MGGLGFVFIIAIVIAAFAIFFIVEKRRREAWQAQAETLGLTHQPSGSMHREYDGFKIFDRGRRRRTKNMITGSYQDAEVTVGDYAYTTGGRSGTSISIGSSSSSRKNNSKTHHQTVFVIKADGLRVPHFFIRRQLKLFDFLGKSFGGQDIDFEEDEGFSKAFVLQGEDESATRELFGPGVREALMAHNGSKMMLEGYGDTLVLHWGQRTDPSGLQDNLDLLMDLKTSLAAS